MHESSYTYPAVLSYSDDGIAITFPDFPGCISEAQSDEEAFRNATNVLELQLASSELVGEEIPAATNVKDIKTGMNECIIMVSVNIDRAKRELDSRYVRKNLTIPEWLNKKALEAGINFSQVLQEALKERLNLR